MSMYLYGSLIAIQRHLLHIEGLKVVYFFYDIYLVLRLKYYLADMCTHILETVVPSRGTKPKIKTV